MQSPAGLVLERETLRWVQSKRCPELVTGFFNVSIRPKFTINRVSLLKGNDVAEEEVTPVLGILDQPDLQVNLMTHSETTGGNTAE